MRGRSLADVVFSAAGLFIVWGAKKLFKLALIGIWKLIRHPRSTVTAGAVAALLFALGWKLCLTGVVILLLGGSVWKAAHAPSWEASFGGWLRTWWRRWWTYRRTWEKTLTRCELVIDLDNERHVPRRPKVASSLYWDSLAVKLQVGQEVIDWRLASERLRHAWKSERLSVREIEPGRVGVEVMRRDPLRLLPVAATAMPETTAEIDFSRIRVGLTEHLEPFTVSVVGGHTCVSGASGSGKGSFHWNLLRGLAPAIGDRIVQPVGIDPKGKELGRARPLYGDYYAVTEEETLDLLQRLVQEMQEANARDVALGERDFVPSIGRPLRLIQIDELAPLLAYWKRTTLQKIEDALGLLLTQGRACGFIVIGEIQEPTKDIFTMRDLFARRLALRLPTEDHTDAALTDKAVDRGALCHEIPESMPGLLFSLGSGERHAVRSRLGNTTDDDIEDLVTFVEARWGVTQLDEWRKTAVA